MLKVLETSKSSRALRLIDDADALAELMRAVEATELVAIDTEFIRETTYYPKLCVLQVATPQMAGCVDCLAPLELQPLFRLLAAQGRTWLLHSARQDLEVVQHYADIRPTRLIDTQIAASLAGLAPQISLQDVLATILDVNLGKEFTRTNWSLRPLVDGAVQYALDDVLHLLPMWKQLEQQLSDLGRVAWLEEDSARLLEESATIDLLIVWRRIKGVQHFDRDSQNATMALVGWREKTAQTLDRPRRWIMSDDLLARLALHKPATMAALADTPDMPGRLASRSGADLLAAIQARDEPHITVLVDKAAQPARPDKQAIKALQGRIRERAQTLGIEAEVLATRRDIDSILLGTAPEHLAHGWRAAEVNPSEHNPARSTGSR